MSNSVKETIRKVLWDPGVLSTLSNLIDILRRVDDLSAFREAVENEDWEAAIEMVDLSEREFNERMDNIRTNSVAIAEEHPEFTDLSHEEIEQEL